MRFPHKKLAPRLSWMQKYEWREKMRLRTAEMSPSFFFLFDIKLRVGSEEMENKRLAAVVTGERPNLNELLIPWWPPITDFVYYSIRTLNNLMNQMLTNQCFDGQEGLRWLGWPRRLRKRPRAP